MGLFRWEERKMRGRERDIDKKRGKKRQSRRLFAIFALKTTLTWALVSVLRAQQNKAGESAERTT